MGLAEHDIGSGMAARGTQGSWTPPSGGGSVAPANARSVNKSVNKLTCWTKLGSRTRYRILDVILSCVLFTPLAVLFQVSSCGVQDVLILNHVPGYAGTAILLLVGLAIEFSCSFWQKYLSSIRERNPDDLSYVVTIRIYHLAVGFANVCHYRGLGDVYYFLFGSGSYAAIQAAATTIVLLSSLRCVRNILGPPLSVSADCGIQNVFETGTLFRTQEDAGYRHFADHVSTVTVVTSLCFLNWIAEWAFFDRVLFPENAILSVIASWIVGYAVVVVAFVLETTAVEISRRLDTAGGLGKLLFEDAFLVLANSGVILVWRGHWMFFESLMFYFPVYHFGVDVSALYGIVCSFAMVCLLQASATLILKGCDFDGELPDGQGVSFGICYLTEFFQDRIAEEEAAAKELGAEEPAPGAGRVRKDVSSRVKNRSKKKN